MKEICFPMPKQPPPGKYELCTQAMWTGKIWVFDDSRLISEHKKESIFTAPLKANAPEHYYHGAWFLLVAVFAYGFGKLMGESST